MAQKGEIISAGTRIYVTGAAGFLGSNLVDRLLALGCRVTASDNFQTGLRSNIAHLANNASFTFIEHDVADPIDVKADVIFNLACPASPPHYQADPVRTLKTSVYGVMNLLEMAARHGARFVQASTSEVYGDPLEHPQKETYWGHVNPIGIRSCYDEGKRAAETLCFDFHRSKGVDIKVARIFNTYGPRMRPDDGRAVSNFIVQALAGKDITMYGDGTQTRSFCYVDDLISGLVALGGASRDVTGPINIGNPAEFELRELAALVLELTGSKSRITHQPLPQDDPKQRKPDISRAARVLGWAPKITLRQGLEKTISFFKSSAATHI